MTLFFLITICLDSIVCIIDYFTLIIPFCICLSTYMPWSAFFKHLHLFLFNSTCMLFACSYLSNILFIVVRDINLSVSITTPADQFKSFVQAAGVHVAQWGSFPLLLILLYLIFCTLYLAFTFPPTPILWHDRLVVIVVPPALQVKLTVDQTGIACTCHNLFNLPVELFCSVLFDDVVIGLSEFIPPPTIHGVWRLVLILQLISTGVRYRLYLWIAFVGTVLEQCTGVGCTEDSVQCVGGEDGWHRGLVVEIPTPTREFVRDAVDVTGVVATWLQEVGVFYTGGCLQNWWWWWWWW